jgi:hypothetical protein
MHRRRSHLALLLSPLLALLGCLPGSGTIKILGDSGLGLDGALVADGAAPPETRIVTPDTGGGTVDGGGGTLDTGGQPKLDTKPTPKPDTTAACPAPPFGTAKGMSANNFVKIPDCKGVQYTLHPLCGKHKAIVMAMMSPS